MGYLKFTSFLLLIAAGIFLFIFGGYDDSPGAQGLGLLIVALGVWRLIKNRRQHNK